MVRLNKFECPGRGLQNENPHEGMTKNQAGWWWWSCWVKVSRYHKLWGLLVKLVKYDIPYWRRPTLMSGRAVSSPVIGSGVAWAALICRRPAVARAPHRAVVGATRLSMSDIVFRVEEENKTLVQLFLSDNLSLITPRSGSSGLDSSQMISTTSAFRHIRMSRPSKTTLRNSLSQKSISLPWH